VSDIAVVADDLGKQYRIGVEAQRHAYGSLRETLSGAFKAPYRAIKSRLTHFSGLVKEDDPRMFWALRHVSFEVAHGEAVGVIGRNGAGKSTLLKLLCRVTEPNEGRAVMYGRTGSLLEVGTGFHPELSGRENIYLNGAILGMSKREIDRKFDEIVAFAETEKFLDTQVKHYSSGMYMRLAFAVAAHLEPEILLVDEVLAVGDSAFQKKCLGRMSTIAREGRTVIFVSHNMGAINALCSRTMWIERGRIVQVGPTEEVTEAYTRLQKASEGGEQRVGYTMDADLLRSQPDEGITVADVRLVNPESPNIGPRTGEPLVVEIDYIAKKDFISPAFIVRFRDLFGMELVRLATKPFSGYDLEPLHQRGRVQLFIPKLPFVGGHYLADVEFARAGVSRILQLEHLLEFDVEPTDYYGSGWMPERSVGLLVLDHRWNHSSLAPHAAGTEIRG
jgi:lipopolysaccharide transport system ATP-binding protein